MSESNIATDHLSGFFEIARERHDLNPTHISLFFAVFQIWSIHHFNNPFYITRRELMEMSKISSFATYHKCINELEQYGFIEYSPTFNTYKGSSIKVLV